MKRIKLTQGKYTLVDDDDFTELNKNKWYAKKAGRTFYATRNEKGIRMHRVIMNPPKNMEVDHKDGDGLNNQKSNLRICTHSQNAKNKGKRKSNKSGYKGVCWDEHSKKWHAQIVFNKKTKHLGKFTSKLLAYEAYCKACKKYHGEFYNIN